MKRSNRPTPRETPAAMRAIPPMVELTAKLRQMNHEKLLRFIVQYFEEQTPETQRLINRKLDQ